MRFRAKNALLAKMKPKKAICELKIKNKSKIILRNINVFLAFI
jgi:hypothetical protein